MRHIELIPLIDPSGDRLSVKGYAERKWAEKQNLCHLTTLIMPVRADHRIHIQVRPPLKSFPGCRDIFGGHVTFTGDLLGCLLGEPFDLDAIVDRSAVREANEELRPRADRDSSPMDVESDSLRRVGNLGEFVWEAPGNVERSTLYHFPIREGCELVPMDDIEGRFVHVETEILEFEELVARFLESKAKPYSSRVSPQDRYTENKASWKFADGVGRILENSHLRQKVLDAIRSIPSAAFSRI